MALVPQMCKYDTPFLPTGCPEDEGCGAWKTHLPRKKKLVLEFGRNFSPVKYNEGISVGIFPSGDDEHESGGDCVTYSLSKTGDLIILSGSDGSYSSVKDGSGLTDEDLERVEDIATEAASTAVSAVSSALNAHASNSTVHVTSAEKEEWSEHLQATVDDDTLVLSYGSN